MSEDLKKIREALEVATKEISFDTITAAREALRLFDAHVAALSQQEAEPVAVVIEANSGSIVGIAQTKSGALKAGDKLYSEPPKPAPLPQPVASAPQEVDYLTLSDLTSWLPKGTTHITKIQVRTCAWSPLLSSFEAFKYDENGDLLVYRTDSDNEYPGWILASRAFKKIPEIFPIAASQEGV